MNSSPEPLLPADVDLRDFTFMPLDVVRLRDSGLAVYASGEEFRAAVLLWCASWHQVPAASVPDDDAMLAHLVGLGRSVKEWKKLRDGALRGWIKCSDGRFYHPVIAEKALEAWDRRGEFADKKENTESRQKRWRARVKQFSAQLRSLGITPPKGASLEVLISLLKDNGVDVDVDGMSSTSPSTVDDGEMPLTGIGTGKGNIKQHTQGDAAPDDSLIGSVRQWQPANKILFAKLHIAGVPPPDPSQLPRLLDEFHSHYANKALTDSQCYTKFVNWIRNDRHGKQPTQHTGTHARSRQPARRLTAAEQIEHDCRAELDRIRRAEGD